MSTSDALRAVEDRAAELVAQAIQRRREDLLGAGVTIDVDPVARLGSAASYQSYLEATVTARGEIHDVIFFYVVRDGRIVVDVDDLPGWLDTAIDETLTDTAEP